MASHECPNEKRMEAVEDAVRVGNECLTQIKVKAKGQSGRAEEAHRRIDETNETAAKLAEEVKVMKVNTDERDRAQDTALNKLGWQMGMIVVAFVTGVQVAFFVAARLWPA